ncbi:MAG: NUDIX hydrolase [Nocardioidaceae bacterium]
MDPTRRLPTKLAEHARSFNERGATPVEPRHASTVVLLKEGDGSPGSLRLYLLRRHVDMAFAAGMYVFPGGRVDPRDYDGEVGWTGPSAEEWAVTLATDAALARALVCAAVRETFEESGVLLAGASADEVVADTTGEDWEADRKALEAHDLSFTEFLSRRRLMLRSDLLRMWGTWVTPVFEPRRYDTRFFVARMPSGQVTRDVSTESDAVAWSSVREAIEAVDDRRMLMLPPTYCTCLELFDLPTTEAAFRAVRPAEVIEPEAIMDEQGAYLSIPDRLVVLGKDVAARLRG